MNDFLKLFIFIGILIYVISPVDLCPGPIDDIIIIMCAYASQKRVDRIE